jgi:hypothetical protein
MNLRNLVCTAFLVNVVWFTLVKLVEISQYVLIKEHKTNCEKAEQDKSAKKLSAKNYVLHSSVFLLQLTNTTIVLNYF